MEKPPLSRGLFLCQSFFFNKSRKFKLSVESNKAYCYDDCTQKE